MSSEAALSPSIASRGERRSGGDDGDKGFDAHPRYPDKSASKCRPREGGSAHKAGTVLSPLSLPVVRESELLSFGRKKKKKKKEARKGSWRVGAKL